MAESIAMGDETEQILEREALRHQSRYSPSKRAQMDSYTRDQYGNLEIPREVSSSINGAQRRLNGEISNRVDSEDPPMMHELPTPGSRSHWESQPSKTPHISVETGTDLSRTLKRINEEIDGASHYDAAKRRKSSGTSLSVTVPALTLDTDLEQEIDLTVSETAFQNGHAAAHTTTRPDVPSVNGTVLLDTSLPADKSMGHVLTEPQSLMEATLPSKWRPVEEPTNAPGSTPRANIPESHNHPDPPRGAEESIAELRLLVQTKDQEIHALREAMTGLARNHDLEMERLQKLLHQEYSRQASDRLRNLYQRAETRAQVAAESHYRSEIEELRNQVQVERDQKSELVRACDKYLNLNGF